MHDPTIGVGDASLGIGTNDHRSFRLMTTFPRAHAIEVIGDFDLAFEEAEPLWF